MKKLILFSILILFTACGKPRTIKIVAKNAATGVPYAGLPYVVQSSRTTSSGEKYRSEAEGVLNQNGEAIVQLKQKTGRSYSIVVKEPENICYTKQYQQYFDSPFEVNGTFTFEFAECASLQRKVTNSNCFNESDKIEIYIDNSVHSLLTKPWILGGCADKTTSPSKVPVGEYYVHWFVTKNNLTTQYNDTFNLIENQIKFYEINY